jgi:hypothetical protein
MGKNGGSYHDYAWMTAHSEEILPLCEQRGTFGPDNAFRENLDTARNNRLGTVPFRHIREHAR